MNAHLNITKLGCVAEEYHRNVYGESTSALHRGTPTDRLVAQWRIDTPHVERRLASAPELRFRTREVADAPVVNRTVMAGGWRRCADIDMDLDARRIWLEILTGFTGHAAPGATWRSTGGCRRVRSSKPTSRAATASSISPSTANTDSGVPCSAADTPE